MLSPKSRGTRLVVRAWAKWSVVWVWLCMVMLFPGKRVSVLLWTSLLIQINHVNNFSNKYYHTPLIIVFITLYWKIILTVRYGKLPHKLQLINHSPCSKILLLSKWGYILGLATFASKNWISKFKTITVKLYIWCLTLRIHYNPFHSGFDSNYSWG